MGYNRANYNRIREAYGEKYKRAEEAAEMRRAEVYMAIPALRALDREIGGVGLDILRAALSGNPEEAIQALRSRNQALREARGMLLVQGGFPEDYTDIRYECPKCGDTGYVDCKMCDCMRRELIAAAYETSGMAHLLETQSFENFSLDYYADTPENLRTMQQILNTMKAYAQSFETLENKNVIMMGGTGLGKTHLSTAVAKVIIDKGYDVYYTGAVQMFADFEYQRFGNSTVGEGVNDTSRYFECDLLIIDDLGVEISNQFTASVLYNVINTRLNRGQATVINSNLTQLEFKKRYWDRITSRIYGEYIILPFVGTDVRAQRLKKI